MSNTLFILGNGFDLDLGLNTSYNDYLKSTFFQNLGEKNNDCKPIVDYLFDLKKKNQEDENYWFDLEQAVGDYYNSLINPKQSTISEFVNTYDSAIYVTFLKSINDFILKAQNDTMTLSNSQTESKRAFSLVKYICDLHSNDLKFDIYTFNYTSEKILIPLINECVKCNSKSIEREKIHTIHGDVTEQFNLNSPSIVVGTSDSYLQNQKVGFVKKSNQNAKKTGMFKDSILNNYNHFIIFGHSLGRMDHSYFSPIFKNILKRDDNPELIIFSKIGEENIIRDQISKMLRIDIDQLTNSLNLKINYNINEVLKNAPNKYTII
jgi:Bacteriophage abortive infection AbiH